MAGTYGQASVTYGQAAGTYGSWSIPATSVPDAGGGFTHHITIGGPVPGANDDDEVLLVAYS